MKKNLKGLIEKYEGGESRCLVDMNQYDMIESAGMMPDLKHVRSAHMTGAWDFAKTTRVEIPMGGADLTGVRYLTFAVFSVGGAGGSFSLSFEGAKGEDGQNGYERTLPITRDGWNEYQVELPFMRAMGQVPGWNDIAYICFDCVAGGQANRANTVLYIDSLFVSAEAPVPFFTRMPELKGAAAFSRTGSFSIVDRKRISNSVDGSDAKPFEQNGILWLPMAPVAAGIAHSAVVDTVAGTLSFTYRRKKYFFSATSNRMKVNGEEEHLGFIPGNINGTLFFPAEFVRNFFHWRQIYVHPLGLILLSNRRNAFESPRDDGTVWQLVADMTFLRPDGERILNDLHRRYPNTGRGFLLASFDEWMQLRRGAKTEGVLKEYVTALKAQYGVRSDAFEKAPLEGDASLESRLSASSEAMVAFSLLYRVTGDKNYCERAAEEAEAVARLESWDCGSAMTLGEISLGMALCYDWCHHVWSEARKAVVERGILRNGMRPGVAYYDGKGRMWHSGGAVSATVNAGMLAMALGLCDVYPETSLKLLNRVLRNAEPCFAAYAPDGGYEEGVAGWEKSHRGLSLMIAMLEKACGTDYGLFSAPGFRATAYFPLMTEGAAGSWNYGSCAVSAVDTSLLPWFSKQTGDSVPVWMRRQKILAGKKAVHPFDILFYTSVDEAEIPNLPLDAVYRKAGLVTMRSGWHSGAMLVGLHGGRNHVTGGELDAGSVILECDGERFFSETGGVEAIPMMTRLRAEGQNTLVINPTAAPSPDQNPDGAAPLVTVKGNAERVFAVVDMTSTNDAILRGKRGVLLTNKRSVAVIQDEIVLDAPGAAVWSAWTEAAVELNKSGRTAKLTRNGKTLVCRLCGVASPARFEAEAYGESGFTRITVKAEVKERLRLAVVCRMLGEGESGNEKAYEILPMSKWGED